MISYTSPHTNVEIRFQTDWIRLHICSQRKITILLLPVPSDVNKGSMQFSTDCQEWDITGRADTSTSASLGALDRDTTPTDA